MSQPGQQSPPQPNWRLHTGPRPWQTSALAIWKERFRGIVRVVTGAGKTLFAEMCILAFKDANPDGKCFIIVPTIALLDQWVVSLTEDLEVSESDVACFSGEGKSDRLKSINVFVINTARRLSEFMGRPKPTFLIVDECHRAGSLVNSQALAYSHAAALGLSATPEREHDTGFEEFLTPSLGEIIFSYDYSSAHKDGVIVPFKLSNVRVNLLPKEENEYLNLTRKVARAIAKMEKDGGDPEIVRKLLLRRAAVTMSAAMRIPVAAKLVEQNRGQRTLVFHERIDAAENILSILRKRGHSATIYHTGIGPTVRRDNLRLFRRGVFDILVSCRALDEGTNVPETTVAIVASATGSQRQRIQRLGRVLRPYPGKEMASVYTIYATEPEEGRLRKEAGLLRDVASVEWFRIGG